jgi:hypothetical protein
MVDDPSSRSRRPDLAGYWPSPWPAEDGGPTREQAPLGRRGLALVESDRLEARFRSAPVCTMAVLRDPGELFLLRHDPPGPDTTSTVERIDPRTLEPVAWSPPLPAGPFWPGGLAAHANGSLHVVYGTWAHRLDAASLEPLASRSLPQDRPYNSFVVLGDGTIVTKDIDLDEERPSQLVALDPGTLEPLGPEVVMPEGSVGRLASDGRFVYASGISTLHRFVWDAGTGLLTRDEGWHHRYRRSPDQSYAWDPCLSGGHLWVMDGGAESRSFSGTFLGAGTAPAPSRVIRVSLADAADHEEVEICGASHGFECNVMLFDPVRSIAVAFDAGNAAVAAFRYEDGSLAPLWRRRLVHASHMLRWPETGELLLGDYVDGGECFVVVDIETGDERGRVKTDQPLQSILFPCPGWGRDFYHTSFAGLTRVEVVTA